MRIAGLLGLLSLAACTADPRPPVVPATPVDAAPPSVSPASSPDDEARVGQLVDRFHAAAAAADEDAYFSMFASNGIFLGTDGSERWTVAQFRAYAHPRFATGKAWSFRSVHRAIATRGDVAWFDEELDTPNLGRARGSGVVVREKGAWKVAQYNLSVPIPNERFADVKRLIEGAAIAR